MDASKSSFLAEQLLPKLEKYCAFQERCISEVKTKLHQLGAPGDVCDVVLARLTQRGFLNEERFTEIFIRSKMRQKGWGPVKIKMELRRKRIPEDLIARYSVMFQQEEQQEALRNWIVKKRKTLKDSDGALLRQKLIRFGLSKGFETGDVIRQVNEILNLPPEE